MSTPHLIQTILEIFVIVFVLWGLFHETAIANFEKRLFEKIKLCFKSITTWIMGG